MPFISEKTWDWCLQELRDKAEQFESTNMTTVLDMGSRCIKSNSLVPADLRDALMSAIVPLLEQTPRDWHPGSNGQVLNLVHPSLYPTIYGKTQVLPHERIQLSNCLAPHNGTVILPDKSPGGNGFLLCDSDDDVLVDYNFHDEDDDSIEDYYVADEEEDNLTEGDHSIQDEGCGGMDQALNEVDAGESDSNDSRIKAFDSEASDQSERLAATGMSDGAEQNEGQFSLSVPPTDLPLPQSEYQAQLQSLDHLIETGLVNPDAHAAFNEEGSENREGRQTFNDNCWSYKFQRLPCDISFTNETDTSVAITSYINNLHPNKHRTLYHIIESLIALSIPAWNQVLVTSHAGRTPIRIKVKGVDTDPPRVPKWINDFNGPDALSHEAQIAKVQDYLNLPDNPDNEPYFEELDAELQQDPEIAVGWKWGRIRKTIHPEPGVPPGTSYADWKAGKLTPASTRFNEDDTSQSPPKVSTFRYKDVNIQKTFRDKGLQVIVKLASIELTPEKPSYAGGNWHIEGMLNEHIVATAIYYFDVDNITESRIRFRQEAYLDEDDLYYEQGSHAPLSQLFGVDKFRDEPMLQEIGSIATPNNRFLAFPNTLQHKVEPFSLADPTKPGHRRFIVLWLVDPNYRVLSTANVPPQQHEWWVEKVAEKTDGRLSREIQMMIEDQMRDGTMTLEEAKAYRLQLMAERTAMTDAVQAAVREYNFCEH